MGTFEKVYVVDGSEYELYRQNDVPTTYQLVDWTGRLIASGLAGVPDEQSVVALIRERIPDVA
jgi:hypothetical protein